MSTLTIAILQTAPKVADTAYNLERIEVMISGLPIKADLVILPEMFNTSYLMEPSEVAESEDGMTIRKLMEWAGKYKATILGSIPMKRNAHYFNTAILVDALGVQLCYDKLHLYSPTGEHDKYTAGKEDKIFTFQNGIKIKPLICYDLRFPYLSFNNPSDPYDILIYSANWPSPRIQQWKSLLTARAIENQSYVIGVNRVGHDANHWEYPGQSMVVNYKGEVIHKMDAEVSSFITKIDFEEMNLYRQQYPFLQDAKII